MNGFLLSRDADIDLQDIFIYTDEFWGERQAKHYVAGLYEIFWTARQQSGHGPAASRTGRGDSQLSPRLSRDFFMPWQGEVAIVRVLHGSRDFD